MALKSALSGGLKVGSSMEGSKKWLERAWKAANKDWAKLTDPYAAMSSFPYTWDATSDVVQIDPPGSPMHDMAPVGALCAVFLGHHAGSVMLESLCNHISSTSSRPSTPATPTTCTTTPRRCSRPAASAGSAGTAPSATCW